MTKPVKHPAKYSDPVLQRMDFWLPKNSRVLDPFAGVGRIHELASEDWDIETVGVEIEKPWADAHPNTLHGDSTKLKDMFPDEWFDVVATSPTYGNRMADHHEAKDSSIRNTYRHTLGKTLQRNNTGSMQWGTEYRLVHTKVWQEVRRLLSEDGLFLLNVSNHIRKNREVRVAEWHLDYCIRILGFRLEAVETIVTKRNRQGANRDLRTDHEFLFVMRKTPWLEPTGNSGTYLPDS